MSKSQANNNELGLQEYKTTLQRVISALKVKKHPLRLIDLGEIMDCSPGHAGLIVRSEPPANNLAKVVYPTRNQHNLLNSKLRIYADISDYCFLLPKLETLDKLHEKYVQPELDSRVKYRYAPELAYKSPAPLVPRLEKLRTAAHLPKDPFAKFPTSGTSR